MLKCATCSNQIESIGVATQIFRRDGLVVTVTGIPATALCTNCGNAVLDWEVAQQVEDLVLPLFTWAKTHTLPKPVISITFPERALVAA